MCACMQATIILCAFHSAQRLLQAVQPPEATCAAHNWLQVRMYLHSKRIKAVQHASEELQLCYQLLDKNSRSFAVVIQRLPAQLRDGVCIFYLVLRAMDSIEDDMAFPNDKKLPLLHSLHERLGDTCALSTIPGNPAFSPARIGCLAHARAFAIPSQAIVRSMIISSEGALSCVTSDMWCRSFSLDDCGEKDAERQLLQQYGKVANAFNALPKAQQAVIQNICKRMGRGMAEFIEKEVETVADYDLYCHYVAGAQPCCAR